MIQLTKSKWALLFYPVVLCPQASVGLEGRDFSPGRPMARVTTATSVCYLPGPSRSNLHHPQINRAQVCSYIWDKQIVSSPRGHSISLYHMSFTYRPQSRPQYFIACVKKPMLIIENRVLTCQYFSPTSDATPVWSDLETKGFQQQRFFVTSSPVPRIIDSRSKSKLQQVKRYTRFSLHLHWFVFVIFSGVLDAILRLNNKMLNSECSLGRLSNQRENPGWVITTSYQLWLEPTINQCGV